MSDPEFDPKEAPTSPDRAAACPNCDGSGSCLTDISGEDDAKPRMAQRLCPLCKGRKWLSREELARLLSSRPSR